MKQERLNKVLAGSLVALVALTLLSFYLSERTQGSDVDKKHFQLSSSESVDRVTLEQGGSKVALHFDGVRWMVNDTLEADRQMVKVLFATIDQVEAKREVGDPLRDAITKSIRSTGVNAKFYVQQELISNIWMGGNESKTTAYFQREGDVMPFVVGIPGYRVYASGIFEQTLNQWRDKRVFNFNWRNFKGLTASFPKEKDQGFTITMKEKYFGIDGVNDIDTTKLNDYLDAMSLLEAESFYTPGQAPRFDSLLQVPPSFSIEVSGIANRSYRLSIYPPLRNVNQVVGRIGNEPALFQKRDIVQIAKKRSFFKRQP
jgi:hypothetical protein